MCLKEFRFSYFRSCFLGNACIVWYAGAPMALEWLTATDMSTRGNTSPEIGFTFGKWLPITRSNRLMEVSHLEHWLDLEKFPLNETEIVFVTKKFPMRKTNDEN